MSQGVRALSGSPPHPGADPLSLNNPVHRRNRLRFLWFTAHNTLGCSIALLSLMDGEDRQVTEVERQSRGMDRAVGLPLPAHYSQGGLKPAMAAAYQTGAPF